MLLRPAAGNLFRVRMEIEVEGNVNVSKNPLVSRTSDRKLPLQSKALFDYEERYDRASGIAGEETRITSMDRYYHEARNQSRLNRAEQTSQLRQLVRETTVRRETLPEVIYAVDDYFDRDELELLRAPACSAALEELLPTVAVELGSRYQPTPEAMASLLNLTAVDASDVEAEVVSISDEEARIQFRGQVDGSVEGVPTVIRAIGKLTFDRAAGSCNWLALAIHETREIGKAEPGFDVAATIRMVRKPLQAPQALSSPSARPEPVGPIPEDRLHVDLRSQEVGLRVLMDRRWRMMSDVAGAAMMRMIDNDRSIAQCDFRSLARLEPGQQWTLEAFQADVKRTLGEQLSDLVEADERVSESGLRVLRVVAHGAVQGVPIQWVTLHFSDDSGRRVLATFTMEGKNVPSFAGADLQLASSLRLAEPEQQQAREVAAAPADAAGAARAAKANLRGDADPQVQSASDRR